MRASSEFFTVRVNKIYNQSSDEVRLPGFCLGSSLNMGVFMVGFPGTETEFCRAVTKVLGKQKGASFSVENCNQRQELDNLIQNITR